MSLLGPISMTHLSALHSGHCSDPGLVSFHLAHHYHFSVPTLMSPTFPSPICSAGDIKMQSTQCLQQNFWSFLWLQEQSMAFQDHGELQLHPLPGDSSPVFLLLFPLFLFPSPPCPRLLFLLHTLLLPSFFHFLSPASSPPLPTSIISTLQAHHSDTVLVFSCPFSAQGSLSAISFPSNILSSFLYLKIKQFI